MPIKEVLVDDSSVLRVVYQQEAHMYASQTVSYWAVDSSDGGLKDVLEQATELGKKAGIAAGSWYFNGPRDTETDQRVLDGIENCDPEIMDTLPTPDLSGEHADGPTPKSIFEEILGEGAWDHFYEDNEDTFEWLNNSIVSSWEQGFQEGVEFEITNTIRHHLVD